MGKLRMMKSLGLEIRLNEQGKLDVLGLKSIPRSRADQARRYIRENKAALIGELEQLNETPARDAMQEAHKGGPVVLEQYTVKNPAPIPDVAALELADLHRRGLVKLDLSDNPMSFTMPEQYGPEDRAYVRDLIDEAGAAMIGVIPRICRLS